MLAAEDAYLEYASSIGSTKAVKPKEVIAGRSDGEVTGISYEQQEQHLQYLQRRMIQAEENVADVERLLVGMIRSYINTTPHYVLEDMAVKFFPEDRRVQALQAPQHMTIEQRQQVKKMLSGGADNEQRA